MLAKGNNGHPNHNRIPIDVLQARPKDMTEDLPEIDCSGYSIGGLMAALMSDDIPALCYLRIGRMRHRITPENKKDIARGMLLALEIQTKDL